MNVAEAAGLWDGLVDFATASDLQAKRMRVLQLHVDELKRQAHAREGENRQLLEKVSEHARQQKADSGDAGSETPSAPAPAFSTAASGETAAGPTESADEVRPPLSPQTQVA